MPKINEEILAARVTDGTGGWSIAGQRFGIDAETQFIADQLSEPLIEERLSELK